MTAQERIQQRATEIYLSGKGTMKQAYEQAELEILEGGMPPELAKLFGLNND